MHTNDTEYFLERAITEREMAKAAQHPNAIAAHEELAQHYDALLRELTRLHLLSASQISRALPTLGISEQRRPTPELLLNPIELAAV